MINLRDVEQEILKLKTENNKLKQFIETSKDNMTNNYLSTLVDNLTELPNKNFLDNHFKLIILYMIEGMLHNQINNDKKETYTILFGDIDGLKIINDTLGHNQANVGIKEIAKIISKSIRMHRDNLNDLLFFVEAYQNNIAIRIGGDEFLIILPHCHKEEAYNIIKRLKENIKNNLKNTKNMSLSIGYADTNEIELPTDITYSSLTEFLDNLINLAEKRMYGDKRKASIMNNENVTINYLLRLNDLLGLNINNDDDFQKLIFILEKQRDTYINKKDI